MLVERARAKGRSAYVGTGDNAWPAVHVADAGLDLPCVSLSPEEARAHFGWMARFTTLDQPAASERTRHRLGWHPTGPDLLTDIAEAGYFPVAAG